MHNKKRQSFCQQQHRSQKKTEYIRLTASIGNKNRINQFIRTLIVLTRIKAQLLVNQFNDLNIIHQLVQMAAVNYVLRPFEGNINPRDSIVIKLYLRATKEIHKENYKLDF